VIVKVGTAVDVGTFVEVFVWVALGTAVGTRLGCRVGVSGGVSISGLDDPQAVTATMITRAIISDAARFDESISSSSVTQLGRSPESALSLSPLL
jgi:hypothetical protein